MPTDTTASEWRRGWKSLFAAFIGMMLVSSIAGIVGVIMEPVSAEFGWSRAVVTGNMFVLAVLGLVLAPTLGAMIARFGARRCALACITAIIPVLLFISRMPGSKAAWYGAWFIYGVINVGLGPIMWSAITASLFDRTRGLALAIMLTSSGIAFFVYPPLCVFVVAEFGWRAIFIMQAGLYGLVLLPIALLWLRSAQDFSTARGQATVSGTAAAASPPAASDGLTLGESLRRRQFWQLTGVCLLTALVEGGLVVHLFPILHEGGLPQTSAGLIASLMGLSMIVGRLAIGMMCDRMPGTVVMGFAILVIACSALMARFNDGSMEIGAMISLVLGFGAGGVTSGLTYVTSRYFGLKAYASILGITYGTFGVGFGMASPLAGHLRDMLGSYTPLFAGAAGTLVFAAILMLTLGRPAYRPATT